MMAMRTVMMANGGGCDEGVRKTADEEVIERERVDFSFFPSFFCFTYHATQGQ